LERKNRKCRKSGARQDPWTVDGIKKGKKRGITKGAHPSEQEEDQKNSFLRGQKEGEIRAEKGQPGGRCNQMSRRGPEKGRRKFAQQHHT